MTTKHHTYFLAADPTARDLLTRLLEWQTNEFGRQIFQPSKPFTAPGLSDPLAEMPERTYPTPMAPRFSTVVAYDDVAAAKRAKEILDRLRCGMGGEINFEIHLWRFDVLRNPDLRDTALIDARHARAIMIATRGRNNLPAEARAWIELWVSQRRARPGALILLVESFEEPTHLQNLPQYVYLKEVAKRARMEFFASIAKPARQMV